jgi:hypothetical protein
MLSSDRPLTLHARSMTGGPMGPPSSSSSNSWTGPWLGVTSRTPGRPAAPRASGRSSAKEEPQLTKMAARVARERLASLLGRVGCGSWCNCPSFCRGPSLSGSLPFELASLRQGAIYGSPVHASVQDSVCTGRRAGPLVLCCSPRRVGRKGCASVPWTQPGGRRCARTSAACRAC